jgi:hypothetical protein
MIHLVLPSYSFSYLYSLLAVCILKEQVLDRFKKDFHQLTILSFHAWLNMRHAPSHFFFTKREAVHRVQYLTSAVGHFLKKSHVRSWATHLGQLCSAVSSACFMLYTVPAWCPEFIIVRLMTCMGNHVYRAWASRRSFQCMMPVHVLPSCPQWFRKVWDHFEGRRIPSTALWRVLLQEGLWLVFSKVCAIDNM